MIVILGPEDIKAGQRDFRASEIKPEHFRFNPLILGLCGVKCLIVIHDNPVPMGSFSKLVWVDLLGFVAQPANDTFPIEKLEGEVKAMVTWAQWGERK